MPHILLTQLSNLFQIWYQQLAQTLESWNSVLNSVVIFCGAYNASIDVMLCFFLQLSLFSHLHWVVRKRQLQLEVLFLFFLDRCPWSGCWLCFLASRGPGFRWKHFFSIGLVADIFHNPLQLRFHVETGNRDGEASGYVHRTGVYKFWFVHV